MVVDSKGTGQQDKCFQALSDATRRDIFKHVLRHEESVSSLARRYPMSFAAVQKHVAILEKSGLVAKRKHGREQLVYGQMEAVRKMNELFEQYEAIWKSRVDRMSEILSEKKRGARK